MALIGATLTEIGGEGIATIELPVRSDLTQQHGFVHFGIVTMIVDTACEHDVPRSGSVGCGVQSQFCHTRKGRALDRKGQSVEAGRTLTV